MADASTPGGGSAAYDPATRTADTQSGSMSGAGLREMDPDSLEGDEAEGILGNTGTPGGDNGPTANASDYAGAGGADSGFGTGVGQAGLSGAEGSGGGTSPSGASLAGGSGSANRG
jgi:hypothetical protein